MEYSPEKYVSRLRESIEKKHKLLRNLFQLTQKQSDHITEDELDALEKSISDKQTVIDAINKLDEEFEVYFQRLKRELGIGSLDELKSPDINGLKELKETISEVVELIREISVVEKHNNDKAKQLLNTFGDEIKKINLGKKAANAYTPGPVINPSYFIDKKK